MSALDELLPDGRVVERHRRLVHAPPDRTLAAFRQLTPSDVPLASALFAVRGLPGVLRRGRLPAAGALGKPVVDRMLDSGFTVLRDRPGEELALGVVGRLWQPGGGVVRIPTPEEFAAFTEPGLVKAALSVTVAADGPGAWLVTETQVQPTDAAAARAFGRYWFLVGPFSGLTRTVLLRAAAGRAQAAARGSG